MSAPKPETCSRGSDGCEIKGRHDMCGTVQKPEMLEKAAELLDESPHPNGCPPHCHQYRVALALEEAVRLDGPIIEAQAATIARLRAELRASEASVESLRKERDRWQFMYEDRGKALDRSAAARLTAEEALEAARAEATKAVEALENISGGMHSGGYMALVKIAREALAAIRAPRPSEPPKFVQDAPCPACAPSSPTPPTSPPDWRLAEDQRGDQIRAWDAMSARLAKERASGCVYVLSDGSVCGRSYESDAHSPVLAGHPFHYVSEPTPPSEEPRPGAERIVAAAIREGRNVFTGPHHAAIIHYVSRCAGIRPVKGEQGFVTNAGRFVDRAEALAIAIEAGQVDPSLHHNMGLMSENLWIVPESTASEQPDGKTR